MPQVDEGHLARTENDLMHRSINLKTSLRMTVFIGALCAKADAPAKDVIVISDRMLISAGRLSEKACNCPLGFDKADSS
jgi:hypothetical protein